MTPVRTKSIPLPCALLALSVAVCLGAAGPVEASTLRHVSAVSSEHRHSLEDLIEAIQLAAKKLSDRLDGQAMCVRADAVRAALAEAESVLPPASRSAFARVLLREALLNLPPPGC